MGAHQQLVLLQNAGKADRAVLQGTPGGFSGLFQRLLYPLGEILVCGIAPCWKSSTPQVTSKLLGITLVQAVL